VTAPVLCSFTSPELVLGVGLAVWTAAVLFRIGWAHLVIPRIKPGTGPMRFSGAHEPLLAVHTSHCATDRGVGRDPGDLGGLNQLCSGQLLVGQQGVLNYQPLALRAQALA